MPVISDTGWVSYVASLLFSTQAYIVPHTENFVKTPAGIPQIYHFGQEGLHNILVIDLLGPSLEDLFDMCGRKFTIKTVCMAARQMVRRHPGNFMLRARARFLKMSVFRRSRACKRYTRRI